MERIHLQEEIRSILENHRIVAIVGLSHDPFADSYEVAQYLQSKGYQIIPVNPFVDEVLGEKSYKSLLDIPEDIQKTIELVGIFRPSQDVPTIVNQAIHLRKKFGKPHAVWMQLGIINEEAAKRARDDGLSVIMNRCIMMDKKQLEQEDTELADLEKIHSERLQEMIEQVDKHRAGEKAGSLTHPLNLQDENFDEITQKHPIMLVDCWADWCMPCRMIAPIVEELTREYSGRVTVAKLDVDQNPKIAMQFSIMSIPTLLILKNGNEVDRIIGAVPKNLIEERLRKHI
jgi:thioredoxin 1